MVLMTKNEDRLPLSPRGAWPWHCLQGQRRDRRLINNTAQNRFFETSGVSSEAAPLSLSEAPAEATEGAFRALWALLFVLR